MNTNNDQKQINELVRRTLLVEQAMDAINRQKKVDAVINVLQAASNVGNSIVGTSMHTCTYCGMDTAPKANSTCGRCMQFINSGYCAVL